MELDDLRGQWQAQTIEVAAAQPILQQTQPGLIEKMRRNAQWELALTVTMAVGALGYTALTERPMYRLLGAFMLLLTGIMLFYYYQKLELLKRMTRNDGSVHGHLETLFKGLRKLLRFYNSLTLATGPVTLLLMSGYQVGLELARPGPFRWKFLAVYVVLMLIFGSLMQVAIVYGMRWYLQRLYGRHLDRLEGALHELRD